MYRHESANEAFHSSEKNYNHQNEVLNDMQAGSVFRKLEWKW